MATCPDCDVHGYPDDGTFALTEVLTVVPGLLSGSTLKVPARQRYSLTCTQCGWTTFGIVEGRHFVADQEGRDG
jgi:predicted nucleic-acid-binding Zn-ribbon protein